MTRARRSGTDLARVYLAGQAAACVLWWFAVFTAPQVRVWTLGGWEPLLLVVPDLLLFAGASALAAARRSWVFAALASTWTVLLTAALAVYGLVEQAAGWGVLLMAAASVGSVAATATLRFGRMPTGWFFLGPFRFRQARPGPWWRHTLASLAQLVVFWTVFFVAIPWLLVRIETRLRVALPALAEQPWPAVGLGLFLVASPVGLWSCLTMSTRGQGTPLPSQTARQLVVSGPYRWIRNPMASAGVLQSIGMGLWFGSWTMVVAAVAGAVAWHIGIRPVEEADLAARFGVPYQRYRSGVRTWIPSRPSRLAS